MDSNSSTIPTELPKLIRFLNTEIKSVASSQQFLSNKFEEILKLISSFSMEIKSLRMENESLKLSLKNMRSSSIRIAEKINQTELHLDSQRREELAPNAIILGLPPIPNENVLDLVSKTCEVVGYHNAKNDIVSCSRLSGSKSENYPIRVTFKSAYCKEKLMAHKKSYGSLKASMVKEVKRSTGMEGRLTIRDDLSPLSMRLFRELKNLQLSLNLRYVWPGRNGAIMIKHNEKSKALAIYSQQDIHKLLLETGK